MGRPLTASVLPWMSSKIFLSKSLRKQYLQDTGRDGRFYRKSSAEVEGGTLAYTEEGAGTEASLSLQRPEQSLVIIPPTWCLFVSSFSPWQFCTLTGRGRVSPQIPLPLQLNPGHRACIVHKKITGLESGVLITIGRAALRVYWNDA